VKAARTERERADFGDYYVISYRKNYLVHAHVDLEVKARELDALAAWETVEQRS